MARKGQKSITIYLPESKYEEIKRASEGMNMTMKDYILHLHESAFTQHAGVPLDKKFEMILERLDRLEKAISGVSDVSGVSSGTPMHKEVDGLDDSDWLRLEHAFGYARTEKQRLSIAKIYAFLKSRYPRGISVQEARLLTNSSAKYNLDRMVSWGLARKEGNRYFLLPAD